MGGLNSGPGPGITLLIAFVLILCSNVLSAPLYEEDDTQDSNAQGLTEPQGCYYNFQHYNEGERILTNEPCLNCTCKNRMLMCYLRVCPFTKGIGQNCTVEKVPGQCCPIITCPEVPVQLLTSSTTEHSESDGRRPDVHHGIKNTAVGHLDNNGCQIDGVFYPNGAQVPGHPEKPCELCYCIRNKTACIMQECALHVDGCRPVYEDGQCFPVRYQCDDQPYEEEPTTTIRPAPTPGLIITTTSSEPLECFYNNEIYEDGSRIQTEDPCEHCYCLKGKIACAVQECGAPLEKEGQNCTALPPAPGKCCPDSYQCDDKVVLREPPESFLRKDRKHNFEFKHKGHNDITMSSQKFGQGSEGTTEAGFSSVADAGHPTDGHYPGEHGATKTTEKPKYGTNQFNEQSGDVTEGLSPEAVTPSKGVSGKPSVSPDHQKPHLDKGQPGSQDSSDLEHHQELDKGTQLPTKHQDSLPDEYEGTPDADDTKPGTTKRPVHGTKPEMASPSSGFPAIPGSLNEFVQRQNQTQTDPISSVHHTGHKDKPHGQKPEQYGDEKVPASGSKPQEPSSLDGTKVQDEIQTTQGSGHPTTESEHILHVMEQQKPAPGIESHIQDTSSTKRPFDEGLNTVNADSTEKTGSTKPSYGGHWKPQPGIYQPDLQGTPFDVSQGQMTPDRTKPVFPGSDKLPEDNYGYSTPIPAIDEDQNVKGQMTVSNAKDQLIDKLHNIIQDVQAQVNDGKTTEMPEEADYKTTTQSQKGHFTEKPDTIPHLPHGSQDSHQPLGSSHEVPTTKPASDKETQHGNAVTDTPKDTSDIFNKIQGIIHGMFTQVTEAVQTTLAPLTTGDSDGKKPSKGDEDPSSARPGYKPDATHEVKPSDSSSKHPQGTKPDGSGSYYPQGSTKYPGYTESTTRKRYPDGSKPEDSEYPSITQYPDYISPDGETSDYGKHPDGSRPGDTPYGSSKYPEGSKPIDSGKYPYSTEYPDEAGSTIQPEEHDQKKRPVDKLHGTKYPEGSKDKYPQSHTPTEHSEDPSKFPGGVKPSYSDIPSATDYPDDKISGSHPGKHPEGIKAGASKPHDDTKYPQETKPTGSDQSPFGTEYPEGVGVTGRPQDVNKYPIGAKPSVSQKYPHYPHGTEYPDEAGSTVTPDEFGKYPDDITPVKGSEDVKHPGQFGSTGRPHYSTKYPGDKYPEGITGKPTGSEDQPYGTQYPEEVGSTGRPQDVGKYPEGTKPSGTQKYPHYPHGTEYPDEAGSTVTPDEFGKYPDGTSPVKGSEGVKHPGQFGSTGKPHYSTKYPGSKYPEGFTAKPSDSEDQPYGTEYPEGVGVTGRPQDSSKYPDGTKPSGSHKYPHGTEYPDEVGSTVTPDEFGKYPDGTSPVKGSEDVKHPGQFGSTGRPHYSTKYPGSKYPEGFTGKPTGSEDPYGTEYPDEFGSTGRPQDHNKYPGGYKPTGSQKHPHYPHGTEYPDEVGSTVTPDEFGKYPDGVRPEDVKRPGEIGSTGRPHYSTKYPESKYPEGSSGKPFDSEDKLHGTEYPEGFGVTTKPQDHSKYPDGFKPISSQKHPQYPHGTEYPEEVGSTGKPQDVGKYPEGTKPSGSHKYPHGTEYPDEVGSSVTPDEFGKYPDGTSPVKGSEDVKYPGQFGSTGRPHYSTKYPGNKYPEGITGKPSDSEDQPYGTEYPEGVGVTGRPQGSVKYPERVKPTDSDSERPHGTEYPEGETGTDRPYDSSKYPEGTKPVRGPDGVIYLGETGSTGRPQVGDQSLEGTRPTQSEKRPSGTEYPDKEIGTDRPYDANKYPTGFRPNEKYPGGSQPIGTDLPELSTVYPNEYDSNVTPDVLGKYPHGSKPAGEKYRPDGTKYPDHTDTVGRPHYPGKYPEGFDPSQKPQGSTQDFGRPTGKPFVTDEYPHVTDHQEGQTDKPHDMGLGSTSRPDDSNKYPYQTEYPEGFTGIPDNLSGLPDGSRPVRPGYRPQDSKYPTSSPFDSTRFPAGSRPTFRPIESGKYPESSTQVSGQETQSPYESGVTSKPQTTGKHPSEVSRYPDGSKPTHSGKEPETGDSENSQDSQTDHPEGSGLSGSPHVTSKYPEGLTDKPYDLSKHPQESKPSDKYPFGTEYPVGMGSTVQPNEFGKYPDGTSPVKGTGDIKHPDQTGSTGRPHYPTKYPGSKYPEGFTGKPSDSEDQPYGTEYPEGVGVTGRPQGVGEYPEGVKPTHPDSERPYGTEYPEGETGTDKPYDSSKYPDRVKPGEGSYPDQTGSTGKPHYSTKYPGGKLPEGVTDTEQEPHATKYPEDVGVTGRPVYSGKDPEKIKPTGKPDELSKYPDGTKPSESNQLSEGEKPVKHPEDEEHGTDRPYDPSKYPAGYRPNDKYPEGLKPTDSQESTKVPDDGASPESVTDHHHEFGSTNKVPTDRPDLIKHPEGYIPTHDTQDDTKPANKDKFKPVTKIPTDQNKDGELGEGGLTTEPSEKSPDNLEYLNKQGTTGKPYESTKYPAGVQPTSSDKYPISTKYPDEAGSTTKPNEFEKHPDQYKPGGKPEEDSKFPEGGKYPHGVEHPTEEAGSDTPYDPSKYPEGTKPVRGPDGVKYPESVGSTGRPHYSTKYPESKYPGGITGKPSDSEDQPYGTEYPNEFGVTGRPQDSSKYPDGTKPSGSHKYPHGTEYPDEVGSTVTPDEFGKYPDRTSPVKGSEDVKHPGQFGSTGRPHYSTKYPGSKYPEGFTGKPTGSEDPYGTEYPDEFGSTGRPQDHNKYPGGYKPTGSQKHPHYPHGTEYPDEIGSTVTPDEFGKYPDKISPVKGSEGEKYPYGTEYPEGETGTDSPYDPSKHTEGTKPVRGPEGVKYPGQTGSTEKYPGNKYPEGFTGKPIGSEDQPHGTEYPEEVGLTGRPQDVGKYPEGSKPTSQKHPHYPHGTEYPDEVGSTVTPDEFGKYPDGTSPVKGSEDVKYPGQFGSTGRPHYSTKYPGSKHPEGFTGKPSDSEDQPYGTEYPEEVGVTGRPQGSVKYPEGVKPTDSDSERPHGTEYPEGETGTDKPYDSSKYPEGTKPVRGPDGVKYPGETGSTDRPLHSTHYPDVHKPTYGPEDTNKLSESVKPVEADDSSYSTKQPHETGVHHRPEAGSRPDDKHPVESQTGSDHEAHTTELPKDVTGTSKPHDFSKYPEGSQPTTSGQKPGEEKYPDSTKVGEKPKDPSKPSEGTRPEDAGHYPYGTEYPDQVGSTGKPYDSSEHSEKFDATGKFPEKSTPHSYVTKHPDGETGTVGPFDFTKHPDGSTKYPGEFKPTGQPQDLGEGTSGTKYPENVEATFIPHVTSKYPGDKKTSGIPEDTNKLPEGMTPSEKRPATENDESSNEYPNEILGTDKPYDPTEYPDGFKPHYTTKRPAGMIPTDFESMSHSTKYPHEPAFKPDESAKHPDGKEPEGVTHADKDGTSGITQTSTKYPESQSHTGKPQSLLPEEFTGSPIDTEDQPHGTSTDKSGVTGRPQEHNKYPEGSKPTSQKHPHYPHGTEYPDEVGSTVTPDEFGKYPDGTSPVKGSEDVKHPGQFGSTGRPHYSTKYPGSKYPAGFTGKPTGSEDPYGTEYPDEFGSTGRPQDHNKYPGGYKPTGSQKHPHYPHGTEYPDEIGSTVTPDEFGKYPDGVKPEGVKRPGEIGSTGRPHYSTKYPGSKYPEGFTGKPIGSEDQPHGTEYPEEVGLTGRPQDVGKYPEGTKPSGSHKYPHYPHGTEYPDEVGSTVTPDEFGKYPDGTSPVKGSEDVKYPGQFGSTGRPHYSTKYPGSKYPEGFTGKPTGSEDPYGTEYPEGVGVTGRPQGSVKYPEGVKPTNPDSERPHGTEYPEGETGTDRPYDSSKYPEGTKPVRGPDGVKYPGETESTGRPQYPDQFDVSSGKPQNLGTYPEGVKPTDEHPDYNRVTDIPFDTNKFPEITKPENSEEHRPSTKRPEDLLGTTKSHDSGKYPEGVQPSTSGYDLNQGQYPGFTKVTEKPGDSTAHPEGGEPSRPQHTESGDDDRKPHDKDKHPEGLEPGVSGKHPDVPKYPSGTEGTNEVGSTSKPESDGNLPVGFKPTDSGRPTDYTTQSSLPEGATESDEHPEGVEGFKPTGRPHYTGKYPEGIKPGTKYPEDVEISKYPDGFGPSSTPQDSSKYPGGVKPTLSEKHPEDLGGSSITVRPDGLTEYPEEYTGKPHYTDKYPQDVRPTGSDDTSYGTEYPEVGSSKYPDKLKPTGRPHGSTKYPEGSKPSITDQDGTVYPYEEGSTDKPNDLSKYPEGLKPADFEKYPFSTKYPDEIGSTIKPDEFGKYPHEVKPGAKPHDSEMHPESGKPTYSDKYPHGTEYPDEVGSTVTPDEFGKYPDGSTVKGPEGVKDPSQIGSTGRPHYSTKYPGSKYPEGFTGKPIGSEDQPHGTEYPEEVGSTGTPQDLGKYPEGSRPTTSHKHPQYPHGTEYPDEVGSTMIPDQFGKYPDEAKPVHGPGVKYPHGSEHPNKETGTHSTHDPSKYPEETKPVRGPEGVKYPGQTGSTDKYPGSKYPEGFTGKPTGSEDQPYGTEYPEGVGVTGRPQDSSKYPDGTKPSGSHKYPHGTEYPDEVGSTVTPDEFGKYPDGTSPVKGSEDVKHPGQFLSTGRPHYSTKYPGSKYPEGFTGKPTGSEDPYGTEYPDEFGSTGRPQDVGKYPEGTKPSGSQKYPHYPHGTEYPDEVGSTVTPDEFGKYPDGTSPVKGSEDVKYPGQFGSTGRPHYSTKYPGDKYPEGITGKPTASEDQPYGTQYPEEVGSTGRPQDVGKYPEGSKPTSQKHPHYPHGTEYPDEVGSTVTPDEFGKYPDGTSPVKGSEEVKYPTQTGSTGKPHYSTKYPGSKYPEGFTGKPSDSEDRPYGTEYPEGVGVTGRPQGSVKYPEGVKPTDSDSERPHGTEYPEGETGTDRPYDSSKYPEGTKPVRGPDDVVYPSQTGSTGRPQSVGEFPEEGKPVFEDKSPDGVKPTTPKDSSHGVQYPDVLGGSVSDISSSTPGTSDDDSVSKQPGSMYLPQFPHTGKPFSPADDKDKPLELPEESYPVKPGQDSYGSSTPKGSDSDGHTDKPGVSIDEMDVTTHTPDEYPKRPDSADLTHDFEYSPQSGEHGSKRPSTQSPDSSLNAQYSTSKEPSTEPDGKVAPHGTKAPQDDLLAARPGSESPYTEKTSSGVSTPKQGSSETKRPVQGLSGHDQSTTDQYGSPVKHPDSTSPGSVNNYSESSDEYSTPEYSNQDGITGKPSGTHTKRPVEHPSRPGQDDAYTTKQPSEGTPTHGVKHPESVSPGSEGFDGNEHTPSVYETTTFANDDLINKLQSIISGIQTQVTNDKTTRQPSTSDFNAPFGQSTEIPHEGVIDDKGTTPSSHYHPSTSGEFGEQKPQQPHESVEYATDKPFVTGDNRRPIDVLGSTKPHGTDTPLAGSVGEFTTGLGEETTEGYLEEENEIHDPESHFGKRPQGTKKPGLSTKFPETDRPADTKHPDGASSQHPDFSTVPESSSRPSEETVGSHSTKHPEGYTDHPAVKPHDTSVQTSSTDEYPEEGKRPDKVPASGEVTGKPDDSIHFPNEKPGSPTAESSTPGVSDEYTPTRKTGSTQVGLGDVSSTTTYDSEKPEGFDSSTKQPGTHHDTISQTETGDDVHETSSTPKDGVLGITKTPETSDEPQKGVDRPGVHHPSRPDDETRPHDEENVPIYHGVENMAGKPTDQPDSMIGEDHTLLPEDSTGTKKPLKSTEKPSHGAPVDEETAQVTESEMTVDSQDHKHPSHQEPTDKPLHVVYPTYYPDGIITRKPGSRPQDLGNKVTVTPQSNVYGTSTPSKEGDETTQTVGDREVMKPSSKVPTDGSFVSSGEPVTEGLGTESSTKRVAPQEGFTTGDGADKPHAPVDKHPESSVDDTQGSGEPGTTSPVIIIEEVHTEVHSERATTKPGTESYDQTTKSVTSVYPHGSDESLTEKPGTFDGKTTKNPDLFSHGTDSVFQEGKPGYGSTVHPLSTDRPQDSLHHSSQPGHGSSVPVSGITESYPDILFGSTTGESLHQGSGKPDYSTKHPESLDGKPTNEPESVTDDTTPSTAQPGSQHIMSLYSPKDKSSTTISPELVKGTQQPGSFITGSRVPSATEEESLYTTSKPDDSQGPTFDHEIFGSKFPGRKTTQKPLEAQPDFTTVFGVGTTREPQEGVTSTPTQGMNVEHHVPSFIFPQKQPEHGVTSTEGYITQGKPLTTVGQPGVIFEGKQTTPTYQFIPSGTHDPEISTKKPFQPTVKGASYVPYKIIDGRKVYYPEREVAHKPDEANRHGFDGFDYLPYEIINGKKFFKPNEVVSQPTPTSTTPKHRLGMYVPYKVINGTKVYYTEDPQGKPQAGVEDYDGLDYVPFDIINGTKVFYPEAVNEPTSPTQPQETSTTPSYIMAMYVPYKIVNGTKVYYPEDSPNKPESEDYDGLDYVPFEIVNGKKVFYPDRVATPPKGTTTPSYVMAMYVPYKIINGTKVYYPEDPQGKPEDYDGLDYVPFEIVDGKKVFHPERVTSPPEATTKPAHVMAMYVPYKIINGTKVYYPEEPQVGSEEYDGLDYVPFEIVNGTKVFYPERASTTSSYESTTTPSYPSAMYVPYKIVDGRKVYYPKYAQYKPYKVPEGFAGFDYIPYEIVNGSKVFYPDRATTVRPTVPPVKQHQGMYVPYKIVNGTKIYYPKDAEEKPQGVLDGYDGSDYVPYEIVNGTQVFYPEKATTEKPGTKAMYVPYKIVDGRKVYYTKDAQPTPNLVPKGYDGFDFVPYEIVNGTPVYYPEKATTEKPGTKAMYVPYKIVDGTKVYYAKDAQPTPNLIPKEYDGFDFVPYEIVNGTKTFYPERVTTPAPNELYYTQGMYVPYKIVDSRKVYYPQRAQHNPLHIPEGYEGFDYLLYDVVNGTKVFHPERGTASPAPTHAPSGTFYPQGMYVPFRVINGTKVFYPQDAQHRPDPMKNDYDGWQHLPYDIVNGTKVFYPERVTTEAPVGQVLAMYIPFKMINGTKVFYANDAQYQPYLIPEGYDGFEYVPYEIVNGTKMFYPDRATPTPGHFSTTAKPIKQGMFVPYKIINGAKVYYPKHASDSPRPPSSEYNGVDFIPYEVINGTKVFYPDRIQGPELETSGTQAMYVPYKLVNGTKVFYPKDAQFKPYLIPEGYDGFDYLPYEVKNGTKVFYPERLTVTPQRPEQVPSQGMFVPYKMINGQKVYYPKEAQKRPHPLSNEYDGLDYIPYEVVNGTKVFYPEYVTQTADMSGTPTSQAMYVPYKIINGTKVFYPKYAQHKPHLVPDGYDGFEYIPYKIVNGTKLFYPDRVATKPQKPQGMYVPYKIINGTKVFYPKYAQPTLQQLPKGFDGIDYIPYEIVNGTKVFYPEKATPSGVSGTPVVQALYVPYKVINGKKVFYPKYALERPQTIPEGYDGFAYIPYSIVNGTKMFYPEQAQFPGVNKVPSLQGTFVPYKLLNSTKVFYPKYANDESPRVPDGYDGVDYVPYEQVNGTKVFYPELISPQASSGTSPVQGKYVPYKVVSGKKVFYPKEGKPQYPLGGVRYPYDGIVYVPYKSLSGTSPSRPGNYPPFVTPEHSLYGQNSEIVYVDDDDESFRPQFISQSRPSQEQTGGHIGHVPGEGSCFLNNKTYENNMEIPPMSPCQSRCRCINSIVRCVRIKCPPLPQTNTANCSPVYDEGSCCPTYSCDNDDLDYLTTTEYPGSQDSSEYPEMVLTGSPSTVISFGQGFDSTTQFAVTDASPHKPLYGQDGTGDLSGEKPHPSRKPVTSDGQHPTDQYHIHRPQKPKPSEQGSLEPYDPVEGHPMPGEFSGEDDYDGEDEEPYGPGTCRYAGKVYVSAQQIPRDDPCDFCFCFRSDIICLQQSCPPPIPGCRDEPIQGFCCPRYECHVKMATLLNVTSTTTTTTTTLPPHFFLHPYKGSATRTGCFVQGKAYRVGQAIPSASGPCMDCICRGNGRMECEPKVCTPEPMIRKMIVPAENTTSPSSER